MRVMLSSMIHAGLLLTVALLPARPAGAQQPEVRAVLFFSPTCPHCHDVMERDLPPLLERFGDQLQIVSINAATPDGGRLYQDVVEAYRVPRDRLGVPALVVGGRVLVGSQEIPQLLPGLVLAGLAAGGTDWPDVRSVRDALARAGLLQPLPLAAGEQGREPAAAGTANAQIPATPAAPPPEPLPAAAPPDAGEGGLSASEPASRGAAAGAGPDVEDGAGTAVAGGPAAPLVDLTGSAAPATALHRFMRDPLGNGVAVIVLLGLLLVLAWSLNDLRRGAAPRTSLPGWLIPALVVVGIGVAGYLSFIEVTGSAAVCGPVGDCNTVQQSPYATLFGFLPVGVLGLIGYLVMGAAWLLGRAGPPRRQRLGDATLYAAALGGTAFSAYLTFLEPFVIGASCAWCLTSAAVVAVILMAATPSASTLRADWIRNRVISRGSA
jgi:uncharacterized membrane protein/thiol-disulfide isomerase/thioredoxin